MQCSKLVRIKQNDIGFFGTVSEFYVYSYKPEFT